MEGRAGTISIPSEFPYETYAEDLQIDPGDPVRCLWCGSSQTSTYMKLMVVSGPSRAISGDLLIHPIHVVTCMNCEQVAYRNLQTLRDS